MLRLIMDSNKLLKSALWYAKHGWYVVPLYTPIFQDGECVGCTCEDWKRRKNPSYVCHTPGKHPRLMEWEENASNDLSVIWQWWSKWPDANVGIAAGKSGLLDLDLDTYKEDYQGDKLLTLADEQTVTNLSGSGGAHLLYQMPENAFYGNGRGTLPKGIDVRGFGGQFVAPPSLHPSGKRYQWETGYGPHEIELLPLPESIAAILDEYQQKQAAAINFVQDVEPPDFANIHLKAEIVELINNPPAKGGRSEADQAVITALVRAGATDDEIKAIFTAYPIGKQGKMAEKGTHALQYLATSIGHARAWWQTKREEYAEQNTIKFFQAVAIGR
jgi:hypothetical protein